MPAAEVLATGKPVVARDTDIDRYPNPNFRRFVALGLKSICSVPLITRDRTIGTLALSRMTDDVWTSEDVEFLAQVASQIAIAVENSLAYRELSEMKERLATEKLYLEDEIRLDHNIGNMVGQGLAFQSILKSVQIVAPTDSTVLILGETGTGKELVARAVHELGPRRKGSFVKVNCAAIPASLLESELFGHEKGSFTGAVAQKIGRFELAHKGTLFLDEIGELPPRTSAETVACHSGPGIRAGGRHAHDPDRRPLRSRHQPRPEGDGGRKRISRRPVLPAPRLSVERTAASGAPRRHTAADALLRSEACAADGPDNRQDSDIRDGSPHAV
jgi:hypothetical protein